MSVGYVHNNAYEKTAGNGVTMLGLPDWSQAEAVTVAQLQAGYTAPANGMLVGYMHTTNSSTLKAVSVNNIAVAVTYGIAADVSIAQFQVTVCEGDIITYPAGTVNSSSINFVPFKTA